MIARGFARTGAVLADRYHLHILKSPREARNALAYVLLNERRHMAKRRGKVAVRSVRPEGVDPASSGRWFEGWKKTNLEEKDRGFERRDGRMPDRGVGVGTPSVAPPHTWLLRVGWRRHGLIDPLEVPG